MPNAFQPNLETTEITQSFSGCAQFRIDIGIILKPCILVPLLLHCHQWASLLNGEYFRMFLLPVHRRNNNLIHTIRNPQIVKVQQKYLILPINNLVMPILGAVDKKNPRSQITNNPNLRLQPVLSLSVQSHLNCGSDWISKGGASSREDDFLVGSCFA